jgi:hypothetical protein
MSNLPPQGKGYLPQVLRLKELLDRLREIARTFLPPDNQTIDGVTKTFGVEWSTAQRFWEHRLSGGPASIRAMQSTVGQAELCDEIVSLMDDLPDTHKSLVRYTTQAIELVFLVGEAFIVARHQPGVLRKDRMTGDQFASFFGKHRDFISAIIFRRRDVLDGHNAQMDREIRAVLKATDWATARPPSQVKARNDTELASLVAQIRPRYRSERAMLLDLNVHKDSLASALAGTGKPDVRARLLRNARRLAKGIPLPPSPEAPAERTGIEPSTEVADSASYLSTLTSALNSVVRMGEQARIDPGTITDGNRANLIRILVRLAALAGITDTVVQRLCNVEGLPATDRGLAGVLAALRGAGAKDR